MLALLKGRDVIRRHARLALLALVVIWPCVRAGSNQLQKGPTQNPHGTLSLVCENCHTSTSWTPIRPAPDFDHKQTRFPLRGLHQGVSCRQCHQRLVFSEVGGKCAECHADIHRRRFGGDCESCHTVRGWRISTQAVKDHANRFPLLGAHSAVECDACHRGAAVALFTGLNIACASCHLEDFQSNRAFNHEAAQLPTTCDTCHQMDSWTDAKFDHGRFAGYALTGAHVRLDCANCHSGGKYKGTQTDCQTCHANDFSATRNPDHLRAGFSRDCSSCHETSAWTTAKFDHNTATKFPLTGAHRDVKCSSCHAAGSYAATSQACYSCHSGDYGATQNPVHTKGNFSTECITCHNTGSWQDAKFDHNLTAFPLAGAHASAQCGTCHANNNFKMVFTGCAACHLPDYQKAVNPNHKAAALPQDCSICHGTDQWKGARFDHTSATKFPLTGAHIPLSCEQCHKNEQYKISTNCDSCHLTDYNNTKDPNHQAAGFPQDCTLCHTTAQWKSATFDHNKTRFPLAGAHASADCQSCHAGGQYATLSTACVSCHLNDYNGAADPKHAAAGFPQDCTLCHSVTQWKGAVFDHSKFRFPLTGAHASAACQSCHSSGQYSSLSTSCASCHLTDFNGTKDPSHPAAGFPQDCALCHTTNTWAGATIDHSKFKFPLTGAHTSVACQSCHASGQYATLSTACASCHLNDYNGTTNPSHASAALPQDCSLCHSTAPGWGGAKYDHTAGTKFPLTGAHTSLVCNQCHASGQYAGLSTACTSCHTSDYNKTTSPSHATSGFPTECSTCHTTSTWLGAVFDHSKVGFLLTGAHTTVACANCHPNGRFAGTPMTCSSCHLADYKGTNNPNHAAAGFPQDCSVCHSTAAAWVGAKFDHNTGTTFPLTGFHATVTCSQCHADGKYAGRSTACVSCHMANYNGATNPNHITAGMPQDCSICHSTTAWRPASFDHSKTPFPLTGFHTGVACANCHVGGKYAGTPVDCYSCHQKAYTSTTNPNHTAAGFPTTCQTCHTTTTWLGATFNHTWFRVPHHSARLCSDCHTNPADYKVFVCTSCHTKSQTDSQHRGRSGYVYNSANCYQCHARGGG